MDALPLSLNRYQLELLNHSIDRHRTRPGEADAHIDRLQERLQSELASWNDSPDIDKVVSIPLDTYQLEGLRAGIFYQLRTLDNDEEKQQLEKVLDQLPEYSLQENAD